MNIKPECLVCIYNQALKTSKVANCDEKTTKELLDSTSKILMEHGLDVTPPFIAKDIYKNLSKKLKSDDPLKNVKEKSTKEALKYVGFIKDKIKKSDDELFSAIKAAIAGNVIDFGAKVQFDLKEAIEEVFDKEFGINDYESLKEDLKKAQTVMLIGDNCGEHVYDKILLEVLTKRFPKKKFIYATRGEPIINDVTIREAKEIGIDEVCEVISSGVDTPGLDLNRADREFVKRFEKTDLIIAKGMGNYETMYGVLDKEIYFLFKIKCDVVANSLKKEVGDIAILKNSIRTKS